ncbi:hypothetical protein DFJ58DRAFT_738539 [Suillus subalutaceus]|uniref:uncharacterized protein n=1 Tax=Suillus subalutaceus TaxID=48586 RepID=UPI001B864937|nr:uncharacterized protein DFJ58DRAFT_738539 [Suillus subalutaceus]KAG1825323.1 hypothetical protein DFJ58DRAFT_738539 [Suillus subalutaceus]
MPFNKELDLTIGITGTHVPRASGSITWKDGHKTVLPAIFDDDNVNLCAEVDIPLIKYMAQFPPSNIHSKRVQHLASDSLSSPDVTRIISESLSIHKCVKITGVPFTPPREQFNTHYLDVEFDISPLRPVQVHDVEKRCHDHANPQIFGNIMSFFDSMHDPSKIQCILDVPLAHITIPDQLRHESRSRTRARLEPNTHVRSYTFKGSSREFYYKGLGAVTSCSILNVSASRRRGDSDSGRNDRIQLRNLSVKLADYTTNIKWIQKNCDGEVITLKPGDMLILPPGVVHAVYTPVPSFSTGGHFYHYSCMHLTELSRFIDAESASTTTNQDMEHALETLRRMVIAIPYLSPRIVLHKRPLLSLCMMATKGQHYRAKGSSAQSAEDTETAMPTGDIADVVYQYLGVSKRLRAGDILYPGDQYDTGCEIDRVALLALFKETLHL